jgi:hypothetical protein
MVKNLNARIERMFEESGFASVVVELDDSSAASLCDALEQLGQNALRILVLAPNKDAVGLCWSESESWSKVDQNKITEVGLDTNSIDAILGFLQSALQDDQRSVDHIDIEIYLDHLHKLRGQSQYLTIKMLGPVTRMKPSELEKRLFGN